MHGYGSGEAYDLNSIHSRLPGGSLLDSCLSLDVFLKDPEKEISYFEDDRPQWGKRHSHTEASGLCEHKCTPNNEMEDGRNMPRKVEVRQGVGFGA